MQQKILIASLLYVALAGPTAAQQPQSHQRGVTADTAFQVGAIDSINLFSGNLSLRLPLGQSYPVGPTLSYGFTLTYNSSGWDFDDQQSCTEGTPPNQMLVSYNLPIQDLDANSGWGWRVNLGQLVRSEGGNPAPPFSGFSYLSPDGGQHAFHDFLHPAQSGTYPPAGTQPNTWFTRDSTYLRMRYYPFASSPCETPSNLLDQDCRTVEFPSGEMHEFHNISHTSFDWRVTKMLDRFGHWVKIAYASGGDWSVTDSANRSHSLDFTAGRLEKVTLAAFNNQSAVYDLVYSGPVDLERQGAQPSCVPEGDTLSGVRLLERLVLPDDSFYQMDYYRTDNPGEKLSGGIKFLRLPTDGAFGWRYQQIDFHAQSPDVPEGREWANIGTGVATKSTFLKDSDYPNSPHGTWIYDYDPQGVLGPGQISCYHTLTLTDPLGNDTKHWFNSAGANRQGFGLPFTRCTPGTNDYYNNSPPYLSQEIYQGSVASGTKRRSIFLEYENDGPSGFYADRNHRMKYRKVIYHDDGDKFREVTHSDFDGLGHFRTTTTGGNFASGNVRASETFYNQNRGSYLIANSDTGAIDPATDFAMFGQTQPWVLETFNSQSVTENGVTETTEYDFALLNGFLRKRRVLAGSSRQSNDLLSIFVQAGTTGFVAAELQYGGDSQAISTASLGNINPAHSGALYRTNHSYQYGVLRNSTVVNPCATSEVLLKLADYDLDKNTGLVKRSRDSAGIKIDFLYDRQGRLTHEFPESEAVRRYTYRLATQSNFNLMPLLTEEQCVTTAACSGSGLLAYRQHTFDGLGRRVKEQVQLPGGVRWYRHMSFNPRAWKTAESVWTLNATSDSRVTKYEQYDNFGRPGRITPPSQPATFLSYEGERTKTRRFKVMLASGVQEDTYNTEISDGQGRLFEVCEGRSAAWNGSCNAGGLLTRYAYDAGSRLTHVCQNRTGSTCGQQRFFNYDGRSFLTSETHPEVGPVGNGATTYSYDARGSVLSKRIGGSTEFDLDYFYDPAGRLIRVDESNGGSPRKLKEFRYGRKNVGADKRAGKLVQTTRHNWVDLVNPLNANPGFLDVRISESFVYAGRGGRMSERQTRYQLGVGHYAFQSGFSYDLQGNLATLDYPDCLHTNDSCDQVSPPRQVSFAYDKGFLTAVPGFASSLSYQSGGMLTQISHQSGITETRQVDPSGLARPERISTNAGWDTGTFDYDGSGNIHRIGSLTYRYDRLQRLVSGEAKVGSSDRLQTASYDNFGNLTQMITNGASQSMSPSSSTNRLGLSGTVYDAGGNLTRVRYSSSEIYQYTYDAANMMKHLQSNTDQASVYIYNADDERIVTFSCFSAAGSSCVSSPASETWTLRGLGNEVLRVFTHPRGESFEWERDYVYRGGQLLASIDPDSSGVEETFSFHLDHLGSPRQVTKGGSQVALHSYYPFGQEATNSSSDEFQLKFTGHERDKNGVGAKSELDYMHARHCSPVVGRFLGVDQRRVSSFQFGKSEEQEEFARSLRQTQSWNRYSYTQNNPLKYLDPDGNNEVLALSWAFELAGGGAGTATSATGAAVALPLVAAAGVGVALGYGVNQMPGVSDTLTSDRMSGMLSNVIFSSRANDSRQFINSKVLTTLEHIGRYAPPDPNDPNDLNNNKNIYERMKKHLEAAEKRLNRLRGKSRADAEALIRRTLDQLEKWWSGGGQ